MTKVEETACILVRKTTKLSLDDCLYSLQDKITHQKQRNYIECIGTTGYQEEKGKQKTRTFKDLPIRYLHIDIAQVNTEEVRHYLFDAVDRTSKYAYVELHEKTTSENAYCFPKT